MHNYNGLPFAIAALLLVIGFGCAQDTSGTRFGNLPPQVWLSAAPPEGSTAEYTLHLYWGGWDPDGEISHYEYAITNNETGVFDPADTTGADSWHSVAANDSTFLFTADRLADSASTDFDNLKTVEFERPHTFFIRAVDDQGATSRPEYRSFTSRTLSPTVDIIVPRSAGLTPAAMPPIATFRWTAKDFVGSTIQQQDPDSVRWIVAPVKRFGNDFDKTIEYVRTTPHAPEWSDWRYYKAPGDSGKRWTSYPLDVGEAYIFALQVKDEAGAVNPVFDEKRNLRRIRASARKSGPLLVVNNRYLWTLRTSSPNPLPVIIDLPAGVGMDFCFSADATEYGGIVAAYRYGWDVLDLNDEAQWDVGYTPFPTNKQPTVTVCTKLRKYFFGSHTFHIEVIDNNSFKSRVSVIVNIIPFTMSRSVLLVDDWFEGLANTAGWSVSNGATPSDTEHDAFWLDMLDGVDGFDPSFDVVQIGGSKGQPYLPITKLAQYESVVWIGNGSYSGIQRSLLAEVIRFNDPKRPVTSGKVQPNIVALFMAAGGHVMLAGDQLMTGVINKEVNFASRAIVYPFIFRYEIDGDQDGSYTGDGNDVGKRGVGETSFAYAECCLNVLDIAYVASSLNVRRPPNQPTGHGCPVNTIRDHEGAKDGIREARPVDTKYSFPLLALRPETAATGKFYAVQTLGLDTDVYNPIYFHERTQCKSVAEIKPLRSCFKPVYALGCRNPSSKIFGAPIAFWTTVFADRVPDAGGVAARSIIFGFHPVYFNPNQFQKAMDIILFNEWKLGRVPAPTMTSAETLN